MAMFNKILDAGPLYCALNVAYVLQHIVWHICRPVFECTLFLYSTLLTVLRNCRPFPALVIHMNTVAIKIHNTICVYP